MTATPLVDKSNPLRTIAVAAGGTETARAAGWQAIRAVDPESREGLLLALMTGGRDSVVSVNGAVVMVACITRPDGPVPVDGHDRHAASPPAGQSRPCTPAAFNNRLRTLLADNLAAAGLVGNTTDKETTRQ